MAMANDIWGSRRERYRSGPPRRLLALDGGWIRGVLTLELLFEIEQQLAKVTGRGPDFRLCQFFDYIAGTSTGAIIAAGLARGMSTAALLDFYTNLGPDIIKKELLLLRRKPFYQSDPLVAQPQATYAASTPTAPQHPQY